MASATIDDIGTAVSDEVFPDVDLALRRGRHIDRDDSQWYAFLSDAQAVLEVFYRRFGCELVHKSEGYFYLLPTSDRLGKRQLSAPEMLVGQALALLYLDPSTVQNGGVVTRDDVLGHMASVMGTDALMRAFNPNKKRLDERVAQETVRSKVAEGLRKLASAGFVEVLDNHNVRLRSALMRFAEPVRGSESPAEALAKLVARGEVLLEGSAEADASPAGEHHDDDTADEIEHDETEHDETEHDETEHETPDEDEQREAPSDESAPDDSEFDEPEGDDELVADDEFDELERFDDGLADDKADDEADDEAGPDSTPSPESER